MIGRRRRSLTFVAGIALGAAAVTGCRQGMDEAGAAPVSVPAATAPTAPRRAVAPPTSAAAPVVTPATTASTPSPAAADPSTTVPTSTTVPAPAVRPGANVNALAPIGDPVSLDIPSIGVDTPIVATGVLVDGTVDVPIDPDIAGWFTGGPRPGELGPSVIMGHVDSKKSGPGVFYKLRDLAVGADVVVRTTTGDVHFVVAAREQVAKDAFPTERVYGAVPERALRLITCGGSFDRSTGHYRDNIVVYLVAVPS